MKHVKEYLCDDTLPSAKEIVECLEIVQKEDCVIKLTWFVPYNGWHKLFIKDDMTFKDCVDKIPKVYGL